MSFLGHMGVAGISEATFHAHQGAYLQPAISRVWNQWQELYVQRAKELKKELTLGGDGRADSPGHCAKYGTYTLMDLDTMQICNIQVVQVIVCVCVCVCVAHN
jgi:hypothetical protein